MCSNARFICNACFIKSLFPYTATYYVICFKIYLQRNINRISENYPKRRTQICYLHRKVILFVGVCIPTNCRRLCEEARISMSSYRGDADSWDGGPPGAEADYAPPPGPPLAAPVPTTDPWTGASYSHYGAPQYDYHSYSTPSYGYGYDSAYYQPDGGYYNSSSAYPPPGQGGYEYGRTRSRPSPETRGYDRRRPSHKSKSRSVSPYKREREYSKKRDSYEESRRRRSRSASKPKRSRYSSSDRSTYRSRSYSRSPVKDKKSRKSMSSESARSNRSYKKAGASRKDRSLTPPLRSKTPQFRNRSKSYEGCKSRSPRYKYDKESRGKKKPLSSKENKSKDRREREVFTPPRNKLTESSKIRNKSGRYSKSPITNKKSERSPQKKSSCKIKIEPKKTRDTSVTPPRSYARDVTSSSRSHSESVSPDSKRKLSLTPKSSRSRSSSSHSSDSSVRSRSKRRTRRKSKHDSRSHTGSRERSLSKKRSHSRGRSNSRYRSRRLRSPNTSKSRSRSRSSRSRSRSRSRSGTPSEDERRGQFTVADRKRFWKMHRSRQMERLKSPPKEIKPPPGAVESTALDDIEYGVPPEVEGPNFAELLQTPEPVMQVPSASKSKPVSIPIKNDGSFLEMFKKMQEETKKIEATETKPTVKKPVLPFIGKRRGGRVLKTGLVKKAKAIDEQTVDNTPKDAWSLYMQEVKKYRETSCQEERKTRPLVK